MISLDLVKAFLLLILPYEFYRGLGLIDDEDMVLVTSIFGADYPMRMHMTNELAQEQLLKHKPEN
jgi:hypothetical protein